MRFALTSAGACIGILALTAPRSDAASERTYYQNLAEERAENLSFDSVRRALQLGSPAQESVGPAFVQSQTRERLVRHFETTFRFSYQDNPEFERRERAHPDGVIELIPFIELAIGPEPVDSAPGSEETGLSLMYRPRLRTTIKTQLTDVGHEANLTGQWRTGDSVVRLELGAREIPRGSSDNESEEDPRIFFRAVPSANWRISPKTAVGLRFAWEQNYTEGGEKVRDLMEAAVRGEYFHSPKTTLSMTAGTGHYEYQLTERQFRSLALRMGARWIPTPFLTTSAEVGYVSWQSDDPRYTSSAPAYNVSVTWTPGPSSRLQAYAQEDLKASTRVGGDLFHDFTVGLVGNYDIATDYYINARLTKSWRDYFSGRYEEELFMRISLGQYLRFLPERPSQAEIYFRQRSSRFSGVEIAANEVGVSCTIFF